MGHLLSLNETSRTGTGLYLLSYWLKGPHITQDVAKLQFALHKLTASVRSFVASPRNVNAES